MKHIDEARLHEHLDFLERGQEGQWEQEGQADPSSSIVSHRPASTAAKRHAERQEIEQHLADCAECSALLEEVQLIRERASALLRDAAPASVSMPPFEEIEARAHAVGRKTRQPAPRRVFAMNRLTALGWAATIVLAVGVGWLARGSFNFGSQRPESQPPQTTVALTEPVTDASVEADERGAGAASEPASFQVAAGRRDRAEMAAEQIAPAPTEAERLEMPAAPPPDPQPTDLLAEPPVIVAEPEQPAAAKADPAVTVTGGVMAAQPEAIAREAPRRDTLAENEAALQIYNAYSPETWTAVDPSQAERHLGSRLLTVEGLPIDSVRIGAVNGQPAAIVVQRLPSGESFEIVQWKPEDAERQAEVGAVSADQAPAEQREARAAKRMPELLTSVIAREGFLLALRAPVSTDSLAVLAGRIR